MGGLLLRMTAVEALLLQKPLLTGAYSGAPHHYVSKVCRPWCVRFNIETSFRTAEPVADAVGVRLSR